MVNRDIKTAKTPQELQNLSFDKELNVFVNAMLESDGTNAVYKTSDNVAKKITIDGTITYIGSAPAGTAQATAKWQVKKIDETDANNVVITWADGNTDFDNIATDLTSLSYS